MTKEAMNLSEGKREYVVYDRVWMKKREGKTYNYMIT